MPKVLLCEIISNNKFEYQRSEIFPFVKGALNKINIENIWAVLGISHNPDFNTRYIIKLTKSDRDILVDYITTHNITHLIISEALHKSQLEFLKAKLKNLKIVSIGDILNHEKGQLNFSYAKWFADWLNINYKCNENVFLSKLIDFAVPDYSNIKLNEIAKKTPPLIRILSGQICGYTSPISKNPYFKNINLSEVKNQRGCAFCMAGSNGSLKALYKTSHITLVFQQLTESIKSINLTSKPIEYWIENFQIFNQIEVFFSKLIKFSFPPSVFYFQCRIDDVCRKAENIEKLLPKLYKNNYAIKLFSMGVENFSPEENNRLNKNITLEDFHKCYNLITHWNKEYPNNFILESHGVFSFILFTPWTTLKDLELNIKYLQHFKFDDGYLRSKLQLLPDRAITLLAKHDGLLTNSFTDTIFDSGCIQSKDLKELPWKFKDNRVALIYNIISVFYILKYSEEEKICINNLPDYLVNFPFKRVNLFIIFRILLILMKTTKEPLTLEKVISELENYIKTNLNKS